jgi:hypothetical protein
MSGQKHKKSNDAKADDKAYEAINFTDLVRHVLLDMFEFGAHSFTEVSGPYFWNSFGIDFETPMPKQGVLDHAKSVGADKIYLAHTHPLSTGDSLRFLNADIDPRVEIAYGVRALPLGNKPSIQDVLFLHELKNDPLFTNIELIGVVFSASGIWECSIQNVSAFDSDEFEKTYNSTYPMNQDGDFMEEWSARGIFPSYYMEVQKPNMHDGSYRRRAALSEVSLKTEQNHEKEIAKAINCFHDNGVTLIFHPYVEFGIQPQELMRSTLDRWNVAFANE